MKDSTRQAKVLGLSKPETAIFEGLSDTPESVSALARRLHTPRTSLFDALRSLQKRGFVEPVTIGKRVWWRKVPQKSLASSLGSLFMGAAASDKVHAHPEFLLHKGSRNLKKIYYTMSEQRKQRVLFIQPNASLVCALDAFTEAELIDVNTRIKENAIIMETMLQENVVRVWRSALMKKRGWKIDAMLSAVSGRSADTTYVPKEFLNFNSEIIILTDVAYIITWERMVAIEVRNKDTIGLLKDIFAFAKHVGSKVNLTELVEQERKSA